MKKYLRFLPLVLILFLAQSCVKTSGYSNNVPPIEGSWVLSESSQSNGSGWYHFNTGLEGGVFDFTSGGSATFDDGYNLMRGSWSIQTISGGYYDEYGTYYTDVHDSFRINVYDNSTHGSADLYFDDARFTGNRIIATNYSGNTISKYVFRRY